MKWKGNEEHFPTKELKLGYAYSFMRGRALDQVKPYIKNKIGYKFVNTNKFKKQVKLVLEI